MQNKTINRVCKNRVVMIAAGGTGGHIYPAISMITEMKFCKFIIVTDMRGENYFLNFLKGKSIQSKVFTHKVSSPSNTNFLNKLVSLLLLFISLLKSIFLVLKYKPNLIVGFGGYPSIAPILAAKIFNIYTIIHEQNTILGRANKFLVKISDILALSFANTKYCLLTL